MFFLELCVIALFLKRAAADCVNATSDCARNGQAECVTDTYRGNKTTTVSGRTCQRWDVESPHAHIFAGLYAHNFCRNPTSEIQDAGPWCYTTDSNQRWELCFQTCSSGKCVDSTNNCAWNGDPECTAYDSGYNGVKSTTVSGRQCQRWDSQSPHTHDNFYVGAEDYCRNPDGEDGPYCYTTDSGTRWELCFENCSPTPGSLSTATPYDGMNCQVQESSRTEAAYRCKSTPRNSQVLKCAIKSFRQKGNNFTVSESGCLIQ